MRVANAVSALRTLCAEPMRSALYAHSQFLCSRASQSSRTLSMLDCSYSTRHQRSLVSQL